LTRGSHKEDYVLSGMATVGARIRKRRLELGLTVREIATEGVTDAHISRIDANRCAPRTKALRRFAPTLGVSVR
jgi:transcriptional regulator with XRE-family HTH domain